MPFDIETAKRYVLARREAVAAAARAQSIREGNETHDLLRRLPERLPQHLMTAADRPSIKNVRVAFGVKATQRETLETGLTKINDEKLKGFATLSARPCENGKEDLCVYLRLLPVSNQ